MIRRADVIGPIEGARRPYGAPVANVLEARGYLVEEFQLVGSTVAYAMADGAAPTLDGRWAVDEVGEGDFRTRILVVRPADPDRFNGTVLLNWQNVSAGFEGGAPASGELYEGYAWVGASVQEAGLYGFPMGMDRGGGGSVLRGQPLVDHDRERYGDLLHPGEQGCFGMFTQAARAVGAGRAGDVDPMGGLDVRRVVATGASQSAMKLAAYANAVHPRDQVIDGYVLAVWEGRAPRVEDGPVSFNYLRARVRDDLGVPVVVVNSEFETMPVQPLRLVDTEQFRIWEVAGTPHGVMRSAGDKPDSRGWVVNRLSYGPVHEAAVRHMHRWLTDGTPAPAQPRIEVDDGATPTIRRDSFGNAIGGVRLPEMAAPTHENRGVAFGSGRMPLFGASRPFTDDELRSLYPSRQAFVDRWCLAVDGLVDAGALRPEDAPAMKAKVDTVTLPPSIPA